MNYKYKIYLNPRSGQIKICLQSRYTYGPFCKSLIPSTLCQEETLPNKVYNIFLNVETGVGDLWSSSKVGC